MGARKRKLDRPKAVLDRSPCCASPMKAEEIPMAPDIRIQSGIPAVLAVGALLGGLASPIASAQEGLPGQHTGPVQFWASGNDQCQVEFTMSNATNGAYTMDWRIDEEPLTGPDYGSGPISHRTYRGDLNLPQFNHPAVGYKFDYQPLISSRTVTLTDLGDLPNRAADAHTVDFRMILGPDGRHRGDGRWHSVTVTGCQSATSATIDAPTTATVGDPVDLTVRIAPEDANGSVQFFDGGEPIGEPVPVTDGAATLRHQFDQSGDHVLSATFTPAEPAADGTPYAPSESNPVTISIEEPSAGTGSLTAGSLSAGSLAWLDVNLNLGSAG